MDDCGVLYVCVIWAISVFKYFDFPLIFEDVPFFCCCLFCLSPLHCCIFTKKYLYALKSDRWTRPRDQGLIYSFGEEGMQLVHRVFGTLYGAAICAPPPLPPPSPMHAASLFLSRLVLGNLAKNFNVNFSACMKFQFRACVKLMSEVGDFFCKIP